MPLLDDFEPSGLSAFGQNVSSKRRGAIGAGLASGYEDIKGLGYNTLAAGADVIGANEARDWLEKQAREKEYASFVASRPELERVEDQTLGSALPFAGYQVAKQIPNLVGAVSMGMLVPEVAVPSALARGGALLPRALGGGGLGAAEGYAAKKAAVEAGQTFGKQVVGGAAFNESQAVGSLYQSAREGEDPNAGRTALLGSPAYALAETLPGAMMAGRLVHGSGFSGNLLSRMGKSGLVQGGTGATSELLQTGMEQAVGKKLTPEESRSQYLNAGVIGGLVEGILGTTGGFRAKTSLLPGGNEPSTAPQGNAPSNDVAQTFTQNDRTTPDSIIAGLTGRGADPLAGRSKLIPSVIGPTSVSTPEVPALNPAAARAPAVAGGSTDVAQQTQAQFMQQQQAQQEQANQVARDKTFQTLGAQYSPDNGGALNIFGAQLFGDAKINAFGNTLAAKLNTLPPVAHQIADAVAQAHELTGKLVPLTLDGGNPIGSADKVMKALAKTTDKFQIGHVQSIEQAANILESLSKTAKGNDLDQGNAIYYALTGKETSGYIASQQSKATKGAKNVQQPKLQTTTGLGEVPVQGTASQTVDGGGGNVRPAEVQPIGTGSLGAGSLGLQVGQPSAEGIRTSTGSNTAVDVRGNAETLEEINNLLQQVFGGTRPEGAFDETENTTEVGTSGGQPSQSEQAKEPTVVTAVSEGNGGPRKYEIPAQYYNTDLMHIRPQRRQQIINEVLGGALTPEVDRENTVSQEDRVAIVRMSLLEDMTAPDIALELGLETDTVDQQRRRLGIRLGTYGLEINQSVEAGREFMASLMLSAENFRSPEFPDGIGAKEFAGLYSAKDLYYDKGKFQHVGTPVEEETEQPAVTTDVKLQEELKNKPESEAATQSAGQIKTAGGSQGNVDSLKKSRKDKNTGEQVLDIGALDQITNLEAEADRIRDALEDMAPKDPRRAALTDRLDAIGDVDSGELGALWGQYAKAQAMRNKAAQAQGVKVDKEKEEAAEVTAPTELTGEEIAASEREDERRKDIEEKAKSDQGEENAIQEQGADEGDVRQPAGGGEEVGKTNAKPKKPAGARKAKPEVKPVEKVKKEVKTPEEQWKVLADQFPGMPPYEGLTKDEKIRWDDVASRGVANLAAANTVLTTTVKAGTTQAPSATGDAKTLAPEVEKLTEGQTTRLEQHYGAKRGTDEFFTKLGEDVVAYASKGAEAVSAAIRDIVRILAQGVLAAAIVVNPTLAKMNFQFNLPRVVSQTSEVRAVVPAAAKAKMSEAAQVTYSAVAPIAKAANKAFMITDKAGGMLHVFHADGSLLVQDVALVGKDVGDKLEGAKKITPAGQYDLHLVPDAEYTGGFVYHMGGAVREDGLTVAVHAVYTGEASEKRPERLATPTPKDNRISWGCINVNNSTMVDTLLPAKAEINGSLIFVMPENSEDIAKFFPAMTQTIEATEGTATGKAETRSVVGKEEKYLFGKAPVVTKPYTAKALLAEIKDFIRADITGRKLQVFDSLEAMLQSPNTDLRALAKVIGDQNAYGVAVDGVAYLIADRIQQGRARSTFLHEVGAHLGLEELLPGKLYDTLVDQLVTWGQKNNGSIESQIARRAAERVKVANTPIEDQPAELLAYFIEEAIDAGINPTAADKLSGPIGAWFRTLWAAFKVAIRRLGFKPETLSASDVVNLAYGAARLEVSGTWHGTAANFNKFSNKFMGAGEGNQAYGWGAYVAQLKGIAKGYWRDDVRRKEKDNYQAELNKFIGYKFDHDVIHPEDRTLAIYKGFELTETSVPAVARKLAQFGIDEVNLVAPDGVTHTVELGAPEGNLLRVDLAISPDESLDWGLPMASQSQLVRDVFDKFAVEVLKRPKPDWSKAGRFRGADYYMDMGMALTGIDPTTKQEMAKVQKAASEWLDANGVKGIRYYDAVSRTDQLNLDNAQFTQDGNTLAGADALRKEYFKPGEIIQGYGGPDKVISYNENEVAGWSVTVVAVDNKGEPRKGERPRTHFTEPSFKEVKAVLENRGWKLSDDARTYNSVVFNEKNMLRVSSARRADRQRMRFGSGEQKPPRLEKRENGRVIDLIVDGQTAESFELASKGLWDRFGGDEEKILRGNDAQAAKQKAYEALRSAEYTYRQEGPLNRVEQIALDDLARGDLDGLRARMPLLFDGGQLRYNIGKLISHAVYNPDTPLNANAPEAKYAPKWVLGQANRPAQPADELSVGTRQAPTRRGNMKFGKDEAINGLPPKLRTPVKTVVDTLLDSGKATMINRNEDVKHLLLAAGITEDVVNSASKYMPSAQAYLTNQYERQGTRIEHEQRIQKIEEAFEKLPAEVQGVGTNSVNAFIYDSTTDRKWGYKPTYNPNVKVDPAMEKRFKELEAKSPAAAQVIRMVFDHGYQSLRMKQQAVKAAADKEFAQREQDANGDQEQLNNVAADRRGWEAKYDRLMNIKNDMPYAYLGRYGDYVAVAKSETYVDAEALSAKGDLDATKWLEENQSDGNHYIVEFAETMAEAKTKADEWKASGKYKHVYGAEKEVSEAFVGGSDLFMGITRLRNMLTRRIKSGEMTVGDQETLDALHKTVSDLYLATVSEASAHRTAMQRKNITGADKDMMRNLATRGRADAHFLASLKHNEDITDSISAMRDEAKADPSNARPYLNELLKRYARDINYKTPAPWARTLTRLGHTWFLSFNPAFYLQQMLQTYVLSLPYLAGRLGYFRSMRSINNAYKDVFGLVKNTNVNEHLDFSKAPADVRDMLQKLVRMGKIDIGIDADAVVYANERTVTSSVMRKLNGINNRIEAINRSTAAIAAYRGYIQRYGIANAEAAVKFAADTVSNTHGSYDGFNTPRILNSNIGKVLGQFKRFQIIQLSMLGKLYKQSFGGASDQEKLIARRTLGFIGGHMAVLGGALGVPFVSQIAYLTSKLAGLFSDDEPEDYEYQLRQAIGDPTLANLLLRGVPAVFGLESLGKKLAMENVAAILPFTDIDMTSRSGAEKMLIGLMGPTAALSLKAADALGMIGKGEYYKGLELALPNGLGNAMKGYRFATEGITMRNGDLVLSPEEIGYIDAAFQAVGLPTNTITHRQYTQKVEAEFDKYYSDRASEIKGEYVNSSRKGDSEGMSAARQDWENLQDSRRKNGYKIQPMSELFKSLVAARKREASVVNGVETTKTNKQFVANII